MADAGRPAAPSRSARLASAAALAAALALAFVGTRWGTFAAGGSDSYCYVGQALGWAAGTLRSPQAIGLDAAWPGREDGFTPTGFVPSRVTRGAIAPICPPGLSLMMAAVWRLAGFTAMFLVVPFSGAVMVRASFAVGRLMAGPAAGLLAAVLVATSPIALYQVVQPTSDIPAAAWSVLALAAVAAPGARRAAAGGVAASLAILTRPVLAPFAAVLAAALCVRPLFETPRGRLGWRDPLAFVAGMLPGVGLLAWIQTVLYGSPLASGYGDLGLLFSFSSFSANVARYGRWILDSETPAILFAAIGVFVSVRTQGRGGHAGAPAGWLRATAGAAVGAVVVPYLFYVPFDAWWFLRFLLPAIALLLIFTSVGVLWLASKLPRPARALVVTVLAALIVVPRLGFARAHFAFDLVDSERRFVAAGEYVAAHLPADAVVLTVWHSGSVRLYGRRLTISWDALDPGWLDRILDALGSAGRPPYLLLERGEEPVFRARFAAASPVGGLDWPPRAQIGPNVRVYDPADRPRYLAGQPVTTETVALRPRTGRRRPVSREP